MSEASLENDPSVKYGKFLAHPEPGEEVVISGISGQFPLSGNIEEFKNNLYNKVDMISHDPHVVHPEIPKGIGKLHNTDISAFDTGFFGVHKLQGKTMNQMCRLLLERCVECIFDAGLHPSDLKGTKTGLYTGICFSETEVHWYLKEHVKGGNAILGNMKAMVTNRLSYFLELSGPSCCTDTACSSTMFALDAAYRAMRNGEIEQAIVCGANTLLAAGATLQFARLGVLSKEGVISVFDESGTGYVRAEAVSAILLQKAKNSLRIYAQILHVKTNSDGYKEQGITYPSGEAQLNLLKEIYMECGVNPRDISFIEAHGTGTPVGDPEELNGIDTFFATERTEPLLVGSVKSSIGHTEPASGLCSIVKAILAFETNFISPNINFKIPRKTIPGLWEGRLKIVTENTPLPNQNGLIGTSSFGFGGANAHTVLKWNTKKKIGDGKPLDDLPRLICVSGRTREAVTCLLSDLVEKFDAEHIGLIHNSFRKPITNHLFRGFAIVSKQGVLTQSVKPVNPHKNNLHIYFGGLSKNYGNLVQELFKLPALSNIKNRIEHFLIKKQLDPNIIFSNSYCSNLQQLLSELITQLCLIEVLKQLEVEFKGESSTFFGKFTHAYFKNFLSLEEVLECMYVMGKITNDIKKTKAGNEINGDILSKHKDQILTELKKILNYPKQCNGFNGTEVKTISSEEYVEAIFKNNQNGFVNIPRNSVILVIGQRLPKFKAKAKSFSFVIADGDSGLHGVLEVLGSLYHYGAQPQIQKLYPKIQIPVSRGTPMISSKIKWNHNYTYFVPSFQFQKSHTDAVMKFSIRLSDDEWADLGGHIIDGRNLFPATGYLYLVWFIMGEILGVDVNKLKVEFGSCKFKRACTLPNKTSISKLELQVMVQVASGNFEISESDVTVVTGQVRIVDNFLMSAMDSQRVDVTDVKEMLNKRDIYKELRLRGYNYKGLFKSLTVCNKSATLGKIEWTDNWIAFIDNMLQLKILAEDTRLLYVPISIARLTVNPIVHMKIVESLQSKNMGKMVDIPVEFCPKSGIIRSGGIEIRGLIASSISRKKITALPVLEKYEFVPNHTKLSLEQSVRVLMQLALENNCGLKVRVLELVDEFSKNNVINLGPIIQDVLGDQPLVHSDITLHCEENGNLGLKVENEKLNSESDYTVFVGSALLTRQKVLEEAIAATTDSGYILSREPLKSNTSILTLSNLTVLNILETDEEKLVFLRKTFKNYSLISKVYINVNTKEKKFGWLNKLKDAVSKGYDVIAWCQNEPLSGIIGLVNCIRREPGCQNVKSLFIVDRAPDFDPDNPFYKKQLEKNMGVNIYLNGEWGTYRHLLLDTVQEVKSEHCYANTTVRGDLSSIKWIEGRLSQNTKLAHNESLIDVYYSALNFRDIMLASGRISLTGIDRREQECCQGLEFSGKTKCGKRVMGMISQGSMATLVKADNYLLWDVPENWSLQEAATVPLVYATCLHALVVVGKIKPSDTILIHSGTGGIGQAAINLCLNMGCTVFITVGTEEKRNFIQKHFPQISERHIGNSRDLSFEQIIMKETKGRGVDIVLNALAEEKLVASVRCLANNGRFLEIGKFDLTSDNQLSLMLFRKEASYHGVMLDAMFNESTQVKEELNILLQKYIASGTIKPLMSTIFKQNEVEQAFRFMTTGKHIGKVIVEVRKPNEAVIESQLNFKGLPRYYCKSEKSYIICGGLGGFGLELADWLVLRGAKNLILTSRKGITSGYQSYRISIWESYSCNVRISTEDITSEAGCVVLIKEANELAPVDAIFNLAVVLEDAILENQTEQSFETSFRPKAYATKYLDEITRKMCPDLRDFVVFSSVSCGRGNAGQSNYGMSNSVMERICEKRREEGYPALAIQWGAIGDVGLVAELQEDHIELEIGGTLQQSISNCLQVMDVLLRQEEASVVSSIVVAEKKGATISENIEEVIGTILGISDVKSVSIHSTLAELGMDSMTGVEIRQTLEREYNIFLSPSELRSLTLHRIKELKENVSTEPASADQTHGEIFNLASVIMNCKNVHDTGSVITKLRTRNTDNNMRKWPTILAFPGIEGDCDLLQNLTENLEADVYGINYCPFIQKDTMSETAEALMPYIKDVLDPKKSFHLIAHSLGSIIVLEVVSRLEKLGYLGTVTLLDGTPALMKELHNSVIQIDGDTSDTGIENTLIAGGLRFKLTIADLEATMDDIGRCSSLQEKLKIFTSKVFNEEIEVDEKLLSFSVSVIKRFKSCLNYVPTFKKLKSKVRLFKAGILSFIMDSDDYEVGQYCEQPVEVKIFEGTHSTFLKNEELAKTVMENVLVVNGFADE